MLYRKCGQRDAYVVLNLICKHVCMPCAQYTTDFETIFPRPVYARRLEKGKILRD